MIHPTALIHPAAQVDPSVEVGPYSVVDEHVKVGRDCALGPHVHLTGHTTIGSRNRFHTGCVIGDAPQDLRYQGEPTRLEIGDDNVFREYATIHRSNSIAEPTRIGCGNLFMALSHVGHNAVVGDQIILANGALIGGHAIIETKANISANCLVHQFVRVGRYSLMQGGAAISKDLPPYLIAHRQNTVAGVNLIGLKRAGFSREERSELRRLYRILFRDRPHLTRAIESVRDSVTADSGRCLLEFIASSRRGVCSARDSGDSEDPGEGGLK